MLSADTQKHGRGTFRTGGHQAHRGVSVRDFGSAMAPFYPRSPSSSGRCSLLVVVKPSVSNRAQANLRNPKREMLIRRFSLARVHLARAGATHRRRQHILLAGSVVHPWLLILDLWFSGLVFTFLIYVLVLAFANLGKALAICLLILQITGCVEGRIPCRSCRFRAEREPVLCRRLTVDAMRAAMFGMCNGDFWVQLGELALFLIPAALIGFALRKPFEEVHEVVCAPSNPRRSLVRVFGGDDA